MVHKAAQCPVCGEGAGPEMALCPVCETPHHRECWSWVGGCAIYGCAGGAAIVASRAEVASPPATVEGGALTLASTVLQHVRDREIDAIAQSYLSLPPGLAPLWWVWATALLLVPLALTGWMFSVLPGGLMRALVQALAMHGAKLLLVVAIAMGGLMFLPVSLMGTRWRFLLGEQQVEQSLTWAGVVIFRRRMPFRDVQRVEVREVSSSLKLVLIRPDGGAVDLSHGMGASPAGAAELRSLARGLQVHSPLHVTTALDLDPVSSRKHLETLRHAAREAGGRCRALALLAASSPVVMSITLLALLPPLAAWTSHQLAITAMGAMVGLFFLGSVKIWEMIALEEPGFSSWMIGGFAVLFASIGVLVTEQGIVCMTLGALLGSIALLGHLAFGRPMVTGVIPTDRITPRELQVASQQLLGYQPDRAGTMALAASQILLLLVQIGIVLATVAQGFAPWLACVLAAFPMAGSVILAIPWARAVALHRHLSTAELTE